LPPNKRVDVALTRLYGVGPRNVTGLLSKAEVPAQTRVKDLSQPQLAAINGVLAKDYKVEGELRREVESNIRQEIEIVCYRGQRHRRNLPVRGQRTRTNARTRRGGRRTVGSSKPGKEKGAAPAGKEGAAPAKA